MKKLVSCLLAFAIAACGLCAFAEQEAPMSLEAGGSYYFQATQCVATVPTQGDYRVLQGGGTDGTYAYYAMADNLTGAIIYKYDMETWELVASSEPLKLGHANDITYDPIENRLILPHTSSPKLHYVDPDTLTYLGSENMGYNLTRIEYIPQSDQVLIGSAYMLIFFDRDDYKTPISYFNCQGNRLTTQGLTCDGSYVYDVRWDQDQYSASKTDSSILCDWIVVHDVQGQYIGDIPVYGLEGEPENIIWQGGNRFVIGCNGSDSVYLAELCVEE